MPSITRPILTDSETMEMLIAFYSEALSFLEVPAEQWAEVKMGVSFEGTDGKANLISIDYPHKKILICLPVLKLIVQTSPQATNDSPSVYRSYGYKLARLWQQYLTTGECRQFEQDKDSSDFAMALCIIKGLPQIDYPNEERMIEAVGYNLFDRDAAIRMLREEFGIDCGVREAIDIHKEKRKIVTFTKEEALKRSRCLKKMFDESRSIPLKNIEEGQCGSRSNPFPNVDEAAAYILQIEKDRLENDAYRQTIKKEQFFFDYGHGFFRIPWASANVSYYPLDGGVGSSFVVNQLSQRPGHFNEMPRFSIKPSLANRRFLFRGQSRFYEKCVPSMFREKANVAKHQYVEDVIQINELEILLRQHPLVRLFEQGFYLLHEFFRFRVDYIGISQHYYGHTPMLDLTSDMEVAKFFAVTTFKMEKDRYEKYSGNELGVLYYYDLAPDAFTPSEGRDYMVETIGKQPFMRSGKQSGFLIRLNDNHDFNTLPEVRYVFFRHNQAVTDRIFAESDAGNKYMPQEMLRTHWYKRMGDEKTRKEISVEALKLNFENNPRVSHNSIVKELRKKGFHISTKNKQGFSDEEIDLYYTEVLDFWKEFCSNIHIYSPEGKILKKHLVNLPYDTRYSWAFYRGQALSS